MRILRERAYRFVGYEDFLSVVAGIVTSDPSRGVTP
jgi:hypothetical protein